MSDDDEKQVGPVIVVRIPDFPNEELGELNCAASLLMCKRFDADLIGHHKGSHITWRAAYEEWKKSRVVRKKTSALYKTEWESIQKPDIVTVSWVHMISFIDPALAAISGFPNGMRDICWNCGRTDLPLKKCVGCKIAKYCSSECQKQAWWHHKNTTMEHFACKKVTVG
jgi:hypothetical protein